MSNSVWPHRWQPTRLPCPWDSTGKNAGVSCHFLLQCMKVKSESEIPSVMSDSSRPHRLQPTRLLCPWDSPGKSTGIGCHCLLQFSSYHDVFHDPDNQDGVITHLEPNILECEVKWALGSVTKWRWWNSSWAISNPERWCCESAALNMPANLENSAVAAGLEKVSVHSNPKERQCKRIFKLPHNCTHLTC